jgi:hypothetical protein
MKLVFEALPIADAWSAAELDDVFDPFVFEHRMVAYRHLIAVTNIEDRFGTQNRDNPLWGLPFQHQWQRDSGRISTPMGDGATTDVDPDAAWGYGNYTLSVIPWLGAVHAGLAPSLPIAAPSSRSRFSYVQDGVVPDNLHGALEAWKEYFVLAADPTVATEALRERMWHAHKQSLDAAAGVIGSISAEHESETELAFLRGWCRMVDYLWAANWRTDLDFIIEHGLDVLPEVPLTASTLDELDSEIRTTVDSVIELAKKSPRRADIELRLWRRAMRTDEARNDVVDLLDAVFNPSSENRSDRIRLLRFMAARAT